jgi:hypothetical protein
MTSFEVGGRGRCCAALQDDGAGVRDRDRDVAATFKRSSASSALRSRFSVPAILDSPITGPLSSSHRRV